MDEEVLTGNPFIHLESLIWWLNDIHVQRFKQNPVACNGDEKTLTSVW